MGILPAQVTGLSPVACIPIIPSFHLDSHVERPYRDGLPIFLL